MKLRCLALFVMCLASSFALAADPKLSRIEQAPEGLGAEVTKILDPKGYQLTGDKGAIVELWLAKEIASLDMISNGRVLFGVGFGWNHEEMESHGTLIKGRRKLVREKVLAMKELWTNSTTKTLEHS